ncbi:hypothetical protein BDZ45DRAFT_720829 [Acephala macrosclerotiorum]|nr:hypothetical protein BDZ45DRAFT_720829 [Acephala macrosclerotiorum]
MDYPGPVSAGLGTSALSPSSTLDDLPTFEDASASPYFRIETPPPEGTPCPAKLEAEFRLRRQIYADILLCPGDNITPFANRFVSESLVAFSGRQNSDRLRSALVAIERMFGSGVFGVKWEFYEHLKNFTTQCEQLRKKLEEFYPAGLRLRSDGTCVEYPDSHPVEAGERVVTSIPRIISLIPRNRYMLDKIHGECLSSLQTSFDNLLRDEMQARYIKMANRTEELIGVDFFFSEGRCRYRFTNSKDSEQLILTRHDLARALVRDICRTDPTSVSPFAPSIIEDLFSDYSKHGRASMNVWEATIRAIEQEYGVFLNWLPRIMAGRFGKEVVSNPQSVFQDQYRRCKQAISKQLTNPLSRTIHAKWSVRKLADFMVYHNGVLLKAYVEQRLNVILKAYERASCIDGKAVDLCWNESHLTGGLYQPTCLGKPQWEEYLNDFQAKDQHSLLRAKRPARTLTYALDFKNTEASPNKSRRQSLFDTTNQSTLIGGCPYVCEGPGCGPCTSLLLHDQFPDDYPSAISIDTSAIQHLNVQSDKIVQLESTISTSPPSFKTPTSGLSTSACLGNSSTWGWEDINQYEENIPLEEDTSGPVGEPNPLEFGNWDSLNRTAFKNVCDGGDSSE